MSWIKTEYVFHTINLGCWYEIKELTKLFIINNQALVAGPHSGVERHIINFKWINLTPLKVNIQRGARINTLIAAIKAADLETKIAALSAVKKINARATKSNQTDFERFKANLIRRKLNKKVSGEVKKLVNIANRAAHKKAVAQKAAGHVKKTL